MTVETLLDPEVIRVLTFALALSALAGVAMVLARVGLLYRDLRRAAETLCAACEAEYGDGLDYGFADEETVAWAPPGDNCHITFGMVRGLRKELDR